LIQITNQQTQVKDSAGSDIERIKQMRIDHVIFGYNFIPVGRDLDKVMGITKQLSKFAR
jgi:hypothetical protein